VPLTLRPAQVPPAEAATFVSCPGRNVISPCIGCFMTVTSGAAVAAQLPSHPAKTKTRAGRPGTTGAVRVAASCVGWSTAASDAGLGEAVHAEINGKMSTATAQKWDGMGIR
jgi:hypothetical protein